MQENSSQDALQELQAFIEELEQQPVHLIFELKVISSTCHGAILMPSNIWYGVMRYVCSESTDPGWT